jgi:hypothetical protein
MDLPYYWTYEDYFIFKPEFNGSITDYSDIIKQYNKLIFANHNNLEASIETIKNEEDSECYIMCSKFDQPLSNSLDKSVNLTRIAFGGYFDKPLGNSLDKLVNLTHVSFDSKFNQPLSNSFIQSINLRYLTFGFEFNQPLTNSLDQLINLTHLTFNVHFNQPLLDSLKQLINLTVLTFGLSFNQLPRKFSQNFLELQKINLCLFSWETN